MPEVFADTGYWMALLNNRDALHNRARELSVRFSAATIVTSEMVLAELLNHVSGWGAGMRQATAAAVREWMADRGIEVVPQTTVLFDAALERYMARADQSWSIVDCASFIVMEDRQIHEALAFDHHFQQAGFTALLRDRQ